MGKEGEKEFSIALLSSIALILMFVVQKSGGLTGNAIGQVIEGVDNQYVIIILSLIGIIIILAIILIIALSKRKSTQEEYTQKRLEYREKEIDELEEEAKKIIYQAKAKGYNDEEIADMFRRKGWEEGDIKYILD